MSKFIENLKSELDYQGITQKELAARINMSINTVHGWITKDVTPSVEIAYKISQVLNVPLEALVNGDIFSPNNINLSSRNKHVLECYEKLDDTDKHTIDLLLESLSAKS